jgi:hypothetical protein
MARRKVWPKKQRREPEVVPAPPNIRDITWHELEQKIPTRFKGGMTKRDLAQWLGRIDFCKEVVDLMFKRQVWTTEMWRVLFLYQMSLEFAETCPQQIIRPDWLDLAEYRKVRWRTETERRGEVMTATSLNIHQYTKTERAKKPTKRDILDAKYRELLKNL